MGTLLLLLVLAYLIAMFVAISLMVESAVKKGIPEDQKGKLWFIGIFATPLILGVCVLVMAGAPDEAPASKGAAHLPPASSPDVPKEPEWDSEDLPDL